MVLKKLHRALYRKWRPQTFDDVVGQNHITRILKNEVSSGKISHAYLFTGPRGTGKTSCAKILARAINCCSPREGNPCGECEFCKSVNLENFLDIIEIDAASNNGVENIRSIRDEMAFTPTKCKYRVYIVDEVHMLSPGAFNAFLKTLEEPPSHVVFILATTEVHKLPLTIVSRCQKFEFNRFSPLEICSQLEKVCKNEKIEIEKPAALLISKLADGAMRDALSILEQCRNACENAVIDEKTVRIILGMPEKEFINKMASFIFSAEFLKSLEMLEEIYRKTVSFGKVCEEMLEYFRGLMIFKATNCLDYLPDQSLTESSILPSIALQDIIDCTNILQQTYKNISSGNNKKIELEIALVKMCSKFSKPAPLPPSPANQKDVSEPTKPTQVSKPTLDPSSPSDLKEWSQILDKVKDNPELTSLNFALVESKAYKRGNHILISPKNLLAFELLKKPECRNELKKIILEVLGKPYNLGPYEPSPHADSSISKVSPLEALIQSAKSSNIDVIIK